MQLCCGVLESCQADARFSGACQFPHVCVVLFCWTGTLSHGPSRCSYSTTSKRPVPAKRLFAAVLADRPLAEPARAAQPATPTQDRSRPGRVPSALGAAAQPPEHCVVFGEITSSFSNATASLHPRLASSPAPTEGLKASKKKAFNSRTPLPIVWQSVRACASVLHSVLVEDRRGFRPAPSRGDDRGQPRPRLPHRHVRGAGRSSLGQEIKRRTLRCAPEISCSTVQRGPRGALRSRASPPSPRMPFHSDPLNPDQAPSSLPRV